MCLFSRVFRRAVCLLPTFSQQLFVFGRPFSFGLRTQKKGKNSTLLSAIFMNCQTCRPIVLTWIFSSFFFILSFLKNSPLRNAPFSTTEMGRPSNEFVLHFSSRYRWPFLYNRPFVRRSSDKSPPPYDFISSRTHRGRINGVSITEFDKLLWLNVSVFIEDVCHANEQQTEKNPFYSFIFLNSWW